MIADGTQGTPLAPGTAGGTHIPAKLYDAVAEGTLLLRLDQRGQNFLYPGRILEGAVIKAQPPADADAVGVADHPRLSVYVTQQEIGDLPPYPGQSKQGFHVVRHQAVIHPHQDVAGRFDALRLGVVQAAGTDNGLDGGQIRLGHGFRRGEGGEQLPADQVHPGVGTLSGEPHGEQQLIVLFILQGAEGVGVEALQRFHDPLDCGFACHDSHLVPRIP